MSRKAQPPRLWLRKIRRDSSGSITHTATYFILDQGRQIATGIPAAETDKAASFLSEYIAEKQRRNVGKREPSQIPVADVLSVYLDDVVPNHSRPLESEYRIGRLLDFFGNKKLSDINGPLCRAYAKAATTDAMARRDLEELRAAINHHRREGLHDRIVSVVLPPRRPARERWLERDEAAKLLWTAWRRPKCKQLARFILVALYTGRISRGLWCIISTRSGAHMA